jgi:dienelactone hydrolase
MVSRIDLAAAARALALILALLTGAAWAAPEVPIQPALNESVVFVKNKALFAVDLETTLFKPPGEGPFPIVVINHGKAEMPNRLQPRYRPMPAVREFLQRGYAVVVPMRQGFSNSGGNAVGEGCDIAGSGASQAEDVEAVVAWLEKQPWADTTRMLMLGQSHGGLTTLAYARAPHPGFKVFVNFAGGLRFSTPWRGCDTDMALKSAYASYGAKTRVPSLWFYGANDSYFPPQTIGPAYDAYVAAGGPAEMVAYSPFETDAHGMFGSYLGLDIWWKPVEKRMAAVGLPTAVVFPVFATAGRMAVPAASGHAKVGEVARLPFVTESSLNGYRVFLNQRAPRAFAIGSNGAWGWANSGEDPLLRALENCSRRTGIVCKLYAVDNDVVWKDDDGNPH